MDYEELTWREQEVLAMLAKRLTNREIAAQLHLAESTVKDYVSNILGKLYVKNRRQAVERGKELGLLESSQMGYSKPATSLPSFASPFVGRLTELKMLERHIENSRLLTISGPGGAGKTRLAIQSAKNALDKFLDGVYLVLLAPLDHPDQMMQAIAEAVGFPLATSEEPVRQLVRFLRQKELLLVIDNFEHLMGGAPMVKEILEGAPDVKILITSRERLNLTGEINVQVGGMALPDKGDPENSQRVDAIEFFVQKACNARPTFNPSATDLNQVVAICEIVGGMPLAIELAAAWLNVLNLDEIRAEIAQSLDFLSSENRAVPDRHRSIRTVFEHTWALLASEEQELFARISVFRGGFTREAAQEIAGANIATLSRLVNQSIVQYLPSTGRYDVHELLRQYAFERLERQPGLFQSSLESHADYFARLMEEKWDQLRDGRQLDALKEVDEDLGNIRSAWRYHIGHSNPVQTQKFLNSFWLVYWIRGWNLEAVRLFGDAVASLEAHHGQKIAATVRAHAMANRAFFLAWLGQAETGYVEASESIRVLEPLTDRVALYFAYHGLTLPAYYLGKLEEEKIANLRMLEIAEVLNDQWLIAIGNFFLSITMLRVENFPEAERLARASYIESRAIQDLVIQALSLNALGHVADLTGNSDKAREFYQDSVAAADRLGFQWAVGNGTKYLGRVALNSGDLATAEEHFLRSLQITNELGLNRELANLFYEIARLRISQGRTREAVEIIGMIFELPESIQEHLGRSRISESAEKLLESLEGQISSKTISECLNQGKKLDSADVISRLLSSRDAIDGSNL